MPNETLNTLPEENAPSIPCPVCGDKVVLTRDVSSYMRLTRGTVESGMEEAPSYAIFTMENEPSSGEDAHYVFALTLETGSVPEGASLEMVLVEQCPSFDSTLLWKGEDAEGCSYLLGVHFPVSSPRVFPESCDFAVEPPDYTGSIGKVMFEVYALSHRETLRMWRDARGSRSPSELYDIFSHIAHVLERVYRTRHALIRFSPDTVVLRPDTVTFMALYSFDLPWSERCAEAHALLEMAPIPPEFRGYMRQRTAMPQCLYVFGGLVYFAVAGAMPPLGEEFGYEPAIQTRAFQPAFPIGWDGPIFRAMSGNPGMRYGSLDAFMRDLGDALELMVRRETPQTSLCYDAAVDTHIGITKCLRCPINQDAVMMKRSDDGGRLLLVVGDGVSTSTYGSGDIASGMLLQAAESVWNDELSISEEIDAHACVARILQNANERICQYIRQEYSSFSPMPSECMGTTALVAIIDHGRLTLGSIGDSRAYLVRTDTMECITRDHNLFTVGLLNGLPLEMCANHPHAGSLVQCLGYYLQDSDSDNGLSFDVYAMNLLPGDTVLLTTDGVLDYIACDMAESEARIAEILRKSGPAGGKCLELILQANMGGGGDNCGVAVVCVEEKSA